MFIEEKIRISAAWLRRKGIPPAGTGLSLEPGMEGFSGELSGLRTVRAAEIPYFPPPRTGERRERILSGYLGDHAVLVHEGRGYLHEGYFHRELAFPVRLFAALGVRRMLFAVRLGCLDPQEREVGVAFVEDHLDLTGGSPLRGSSSRGWKPAPDPSRSHSEKLLRRGKMLAGKQGLKHREGVLAMLPGPLEPTPAERRMLAALGADFWAFAPPAEIALARSLNIETAVLGLPEEGTGSTMGGSRGGWGEGPLEFTSALLVETSLPPAAEGR